MPLVKIDLHLGKSSEFHRKLSDCVHDAMVATIGVPVADKFQIITQHPLGDLVFPPRYLDIAHEDDIIFIQIYLNAGRSVELKQALYRAIAVAIAAAVDFNPKDLIINLVEVRKEDWSFGNGIAQYVPTP